MVEPDTAPIHYEPEHCMQFLKSVNNIETPAIRKYIQRFTEGPDSELLDFARCLHRNDVTDILTYLRTFRILDSSDCELISNDRVHTTSRMKVVELVTMLGSKEPHAFWYMAHSLKEKHASLYERMHGNIRCCVCKEVQAKEDEMATNDQEFASYASCTPELYLLMKRWRKDIMKQLEKIKRKMEDFNANLKGIRHQFKNIRIRGTENGSRMSTGDVESNSSHFEGVVVCLPSDEKLKYFERVCRFPALEGSPKGTLHGGVHEWPGSTSTGLASNAMAICQLPSCEAVEGRKKYIAFAVLTLYTFYSYLNSWMQQFVAG